MAINCVAAEHGGLVKRKKESSWVKLKAFPTNGLMMKVTVSSGLSCSS